MQELPHPSSLPQGKLSSPHLAVIDIEYENPD
jgi:hypothetical protein